jgi:hypothetical protein
MTAYSRYILLSIFLSCGSSFVDKAAPNVEYLVYAIYCGECYGHCATMFKIDNVWAMYFPFRKITGTPICLRLSHFSKDMDAFF